MGRRSIDLKGEVFSRLTVVSQAPRNKFNHIQWVCLCSCGNIVNVSTGSLRNGNTKSCGCFRSESSSERMKMFNRTDESRICLHSPSRRTHPLYSIWLGMNRRCNVVTDNSYRYYGGKGVKVGQEWNVYNPQGFPNFLCDMGDTWEPGLTIERRNNYGDYCKDNCEWVPLTEQPKNRTFQKDVEFQYPSGEKVIVPGGYVALFCRNNELSHKKISDVLLGKRNHHKNFKAVYIDFALPEWLRPKWHPLISKNKNFEKSTLYPKIEGN